MATDYGINILNMNGINILTMVYKNIGVIKHFYSEILHQL